MYNILFVKCMSQYDAMNNYIDEWEIVFRSIGFNTCVLDAVDVSIHVQLAELAKHTRIDFVFTCNAIKEDCKWFPDAYYITYLCDHPATHRERLLQLNGRDIVFTCDRKHESYIKKYFPNIQYVKFIPLAGSSLGNTIPYKERSLDIVFTGTYSIPEEKYNQIFRFEGILKSFAEYMAQSIIEQPHQTLEMCLKNTLDHFGVSVSDQEFSELAAEFREVDWYARSYYRDKMIRSLVESGNKIHVYGTGWEKFEGEGKENIIIEKGNFYIARKAVADAKISINIMPWFKDGFQERIAAAMLSGAVAVTDSSLYIQESFNDGEELILYSLEKLEELPVKVKWLLDHPDQAEKIAGAGYQHAQKSLTWQSKVLEMIAYMQKVLNIVIYSEVEGNVFTVTYSNFHYRHIAKDSIKHINIILDFMHQIQLYYKIELCDIEYLFAKFQRVFINAKANYPELCISNYIYDYLYNITEGQETIGAEFLIRECNNLQCTFLALENKQLEKENAALNVKIETQNDLPNLHSQKVLIQKIINKYQSSDEKEIKEILHNIREDHCVGPYNQNFVYSFKGISEIEQNMIQYDEEAEMYFGMWNHKRMYYPKGYTRSDVINCINFVKLEHDPDSPHRYLDDTFNVNEGDIVVDAGVAEGNFALDIVEKAKKVYLVECEEKWVEALKWTFQPWADKVVIIPKMLGEKDDQQYASIDCFVTEGYVNFIKMDVEGAELSSLRGASSVLDKSKNIKCAICAYHRKNAEKDIRRILEQKNFYTSITKGYIFFKEDLDSWVDGELRHGLVKAIKHEG